MQKMTIDERIIELAVCLLSIKIAYNIDSLGEYSEHLTAIRKHIEEQDAVIKVSKKVLSCALQNPFADELEAAIKKYEATDD